MNNLLILIAEDDADDRYLLQTAFTEKGYPDKIVLLSRAGWITRLVIPFLIKNFGSHLVDKPGKLLRKIKHLFGKNGKPGKPAQEAGIDAV